MPGKTSGRLKMSENLNDVNAANDNFDIDEALDRLEKINNRLSADLPLNEALELYKEGTALAKKCQEELQGIEKELIILNNRQ